MKDRPSNRASATRTIKDTGLEGRHRDSSGPIKQKSSGARTLGLQAFEKISAVEGIRLSGQMRKDLKSFDAGHMNEAQRSRFISEKYGKK